jgi:hypothetical protein
MGVDNFEGGTTPTNALEWVHGGSITIGLSFMKNPCCGR